MKINKYNNYIIESVLIELINESEIRFKKDFFELLIDMETGFNDSVDKISKMLLSISKSNKDLDILQNYIGLSDDIDKVSFVPDNKVNNYNIKIIDNIVIGQGKKLHPIQIEAELPLEGMLFLNINEFLENDLINSWRLVKEINMSTIPGTNYSDITLYYLINSEDRSLSTPDYNSKFITVYHHNYDRTLPFEYIIPNNNVSKIKIGRYVTKLLDLYFSEDPIERKEYTVSDVEKFTNKFISMMEYKKNALEHFRIVKGEEIKHWYLSDNYSSQTGQLGQSCMRYDSCQDYFQIYISNPNVCQLLIFTDINDKLLGRALLWKLKDGSLYMDRIYTTKDSSIELFNKWGDMNGYKKKYPISNSNNLIVEISPYNYEFYPYMDTLKYYKPEQGILSSRILDKPYLELQESNGQAERRID